MTTRIGTQTGTTCGAACWYAREPECRCSCAGGNHGLLLAEGTEQPRRNCTILGSRYVLGAVLGRAEAHRLRSDFRKSIITDERFTTGYRSGLRFMRSDEEGAPTWIKMASKAQQEKWEEVSRWHDAGNLRRLRARLLWVRDDAVEVFDAFVAAQEYAPESPAR